MTIERDDRKSPSVVFYSLRHDDRGPCTLAVEPRTGAFVGACLKHGDADNECLAVLEAEASRVECGRAA